MKLDVVIPTLDRKLKLTGCLNSIACAKKQYNLHVYLYFSNDKELEESKSSYKTFKWITCDFDDYKKCTVFWNKHLLKMKSDAMFYANDDILLQPNTFDELFKTYQKHFPKYDGVIGINQRNLPKEKALQSAFGVIGKNYANKFPNKQVFCPQYYRFYGDFELLKYSKSINKFYFAENVTIDHLHGDFEGKDETHRKVRKYKELDIEIFNKRQKTKFLWGQDFNLIQEKK